MLIDPITLTALGLVFKPIAEKLAKDVAKDFAEDFCSDALKSVFKGKTEWAKAASKAIVAFTAEFEQELVGAGESGDLEKYAKPVETFVRDKQIWQLLGTALVETEVPLDGAQLPKRWKELELGSLPDDFEWKKLCRRYQAKARNIAAEYPELRELLNAKNLDSSAQSLKRLAGIGPGFELKTYRKGLLDRYKHLKLESLDSDPDHRTMLLWNIFQPQNVRGCQQFNPRVHELPKEHQKKLLESEEDAERQNTCWQEERVKEWRETYLQQTSRPVLEVLSEPSGRLTVILGDPGSGKSVLLQYLAMQWAQLEPELLASRTIPLLIELRQYVEHLSRGGEADLLRYLDSGLGIPGKLDQYELHAALEQGSAQFLFDGLDEIFDLTTRRDVVEEIGSLSRKYPRARFVVTSRVVGYEHETLRNADFQHFMLQDFEPEQVTQFLLTWHKLAYGDKRDRVLKRDRLQKAIDESRAIRELAQNPLLLTLMALLNRHRELPRDRSELYNQASILLLQQWDASHALREDPLLADKSFDYRDKQAMLRAVAAKMQTSPEGLASNAIHRDDLGIVLEGFLRTQGYTTPGPIAARLIDQLRTRNFILCFLGNEFYAFVHRTFLEYFCAADFIWRFEKDKTLPEEALLQHAFAPHWREETWHEVLRLIVAGLEPQFAAPLIEFLLDQKDRLKARNIFLAAECLAEIRNRSILGDLDQRLRTSTQRLAEFDLPFFYWPHEPEAEQVRETRQSAIRQQAQTWPDASTKCWLSDNSQTSRNWEVRHASLRELARGWRDDPEISVILRRRAEIDEDNDVRRMAVQEIARGWQDHPETAIWLRRLAELDEREDLRQAAVQELARGWHDDPETLAILHRYAEFDYHWAVRLAAVQELARGWHADPETFAILRRRAEFDQDYPVRLAAVREIAGGWHGDSETSAILRRRAELDLDYPVRQAAVRELARGWHDDSETFTILQRRAELDDHWVVRNEAVQELARGWHDHPDTLQIVRRCAEIDEDNDVRRTAVQELARGWHDDPDTLRIIRGRAGTDEDNEVRQVAVQELARGWHDEPDTLTWLREGAEKDKNDDVRRAAVCELARGWLDDSETLAILRRRAEFDDYWAVRRAAVHELARGWHDEPDTLQILRGRAENDEQEYVRRAAVQELARGWHYEPEVQAFLASLKKA